MTLEWVMVREEQLELVLGVRLDMECVDWLLLVWNWFSDLKWDSH